MLIRQMLMVFFMSSLPCVYGQMDSLTIGTPDTLVEMEGLSMRDSLVDHVLTYADTFKGCRYGYGSCGPKTFDCSGFVRHVYGKFGVDLPHGSATQGSLVKEIKLKKVQPGDLLFFSGRKNSKNGIGHVAIVRHVDGDKITMIHATVQAGVMEEELAKSEYFTKRFIKAGRIFLDK